MRIVLFYSAIIGLSVGSSFGGELDGHLVLESSSAIVEIEPQPPGLRLIRLPEVSFAMQIEARCNADLLAESVLISVADTRVSLGSADFDDQGTAQTTIQIPKHQIAPLTIENFCIAGTAPSIATPVQVRDALSAQVSLKCAAEGRESIVYQTVGLNVALDCQTSADEVSEDLSPDND
ncbi:MAG: hypothetical protein ACR2QT_04285 [Woeseiaceae bacterium]